MNRNELKHIAQRTAVLVGASLLLGFAYNSASPLGVRLGAPKQSAQDSPSPQHRMHPLNGGIQDDEVAAPPEANDEQPQDAKAQPQAITWEEAQMMLETGNAVILDTRAATAYRAGHIPGALSLPFNEIRDRVPELMQKYDKDTWLITYCSAESCITSEEAASILMQDYGYQHVFHMPGGYTEWQLAQRSKPASD